MKVLLTGKSGFLGNHLYNRLYNGGYEIRVLSHEIADLRVYSEVKNFVQSVKPDVIFHVAGLGLYEGKDPDEENAIEVNTIGTSNLLKACRNIDYKVFVNTGSSSEYGTKYNPMDEDDVCNPESAYAISKLVGTLLAKREYNTFRKPVVTLRLFSPYGKGDSPRRFIPQVIDKAKRDKTIVVNFSDALRDYVYIDDVVQAYMKCISNVEKAKGKILNIGSGKQMTMFEAADTIRRVLSSKSTIQQPLIGKDKHFESPMWQANIESAQIYLDWKPQTTFEQGIRLYAS